MDVLAKSTRGGTAISLSRHTEDVLQATAAIFGPPGSPTPLTPQWLRFFGLASDDVGFLANLWLSAAMHDIGKANDGFQAAIRATGHQAIRHEHLSALLIWNTPVREWLRGLRTVGVDAEVVASAVVSHHLKANDKEFAEPLVERVPRAIQVDAGADDVAKLLVAAARPFGVTPIDLSPCAGLWPFEGRVRPAATTFVSDLYDFTRSLKRDDRRQRLLLAVKAALIVVDSAGSAVPRLGMSLEEWLSAAFGAPPLTARDIEERIIGPRIAELTRRGRWGGFHDFQVEAGRLGPRALLLAGCGAGKTLAAWRWVAGQLERHPASRVIFLYPTRATATEGFRDYVAWAGSDLGALVHGTAQYDLAGMFQNPLDPRSGQDYTVRERIFALGYWHRRIFSATVDSFLAFINNRYAALCLLPLLADSIIVVDEVHSFDNQMFRSLERFLASFDVPCLAMTASLPTDRRRVLASERGLEVFPRQPEQFADLAAQASTPRYQVKQISATNAPRVAVEAADAGKKVLWVVNTVARSQEVARVVGLKVGGSRVLCYHSRFRLMDRRARHTEVISRFQSDERPLVLVSTQVCEMSLDLDADVLITETADVPSLIQRMGRCCRVPSKGRIGEVYVYAPPDALPYVKEEIQAGTTFVDVLAATPAVGQADLAEYLASLDERNPFASGGHVGFLDSGWRAMAREDAFREDDDSAVECVLDADLATYLQARARGRADAVGYHLPCPRKLARHDPALGPYRGVAPAAHYHPTYGLLDREVKSSD